MERILIFTGKGGVGKSSMAAAHARASAREGKKTLLVSTDMAHNLGDIFEVELEKEAVPVVPDLDILEIDPGYVMDQEFGEVKEAMLKLLSSTNAENFDFDQISILPGVDELFSLLKILKIYETRMYERIIVDCAPTGETLSLLKFPELLSWYMEKFFPIEKIAMRVLSPVSKRLFDLELPNRRAMSDIEKIYAQLIQLEELLRNREVTSIRLVSVPEKMVVEETKRNYMYMNLYNFQVDGLYINRILPEGMENAFFDEWMKIQGGYIKELEEVFGGIPIYKVPWFDSELTGIAGIERVEQEVLAGREIFAVHSDIQGERYEQTHEGYEMKLQLPFIQKEDIKLHESDSEVIVRIGNFKRNIPKPNVLRGHMLGGAKLDAGMLTIQFIKAEVNENGR